jgi:GcrA cell cycle regulator
MDRLDNPMGAFPVTSGPSTCEGNSPGRAPAKFTWTEESVTLLKTMWADGKTASQVAAAIGRSVNRNMVLGKLHRLRGGAKIPNSLRPKGRHKTASTPGAKSGIDRTRTNNGSRPVPRVSLPLLTTLQPLRLSLPVLGPIQIKPLGEPASLLERHEAGCAWAIASVGRVHTFCNSHKLQGRPYCPSHHAQSYTRLLPSVSACLPRRR